MKPNKKQTRWRRWFHRLSWMIVDALIYPYSRIFYHAKVDRFREQGRRAYFVMMNHTTPIDQFFVSLAFRGPIYPVASEDIFSAGFASDLLRLSVNPIPIKKGEVDVRAVVQCMRVAQEGGTIVIAPEGNRTYSGRTGYIKDSIAPMARKLALPIALFRIEGGFGVEPRWSNVKRGGQMHAYVARVVEPEEYAAMTDEQLYRLICDTLYVDEAGSKAAFPSKRSAEYIERAMYVCPFCGLSVFESGGEYVRCRRCDRVVKILPTLATEGVGFDFPHRTVTEWYDAQERFVHELDLSQLGGDALYEDTVRLSLVIPYRRKKLLHKAATLSLFADRIEIAADGEKRVLPHAEIKYATICGRNKLNLKHGDDLYQCKGDLRFNALKYMNLYYHANHLKKGEKTVVQFLGL